MKLAWHPFIFDVPPTWEVIRHRNNPDEGQLHLADRHGEQMQIFWKRMKEAPAIAARLAELAGGGPRRRIVEHHGWQVSFGPPTFAARYDDTILLTLVFPLVATAPVRAILESYRPNHGPERHWAAFGLDCVLPAEFHPTEVKAMPALQVMHFENSRNESVTIHRYGMLALILGADDLATFFARTKGPRTQLRRTGTFRQAGKYPGVELSYRSRSGKLWGRGREGHVWIWQCDEFQRLYCLDQCGEPIRDLVEKVHCQ
ncbi:MAG: hypothetical protein PCFJNLEI_00581 [Verrucomicrobiae bacterium]|nr:hypothetical protein [Verrucomicrobiae bacterium]